MTRTRQLCALRALPLLGILMLMAACSSIERSHGYVPDQELIAKVRPGVTDKDSVATLLGTPTTITKFRDESWYYIANRSERFAFFKEKTVEQNVLAVRFNDQGIVQDVKSYSLDDGEKIALVDRETATRGKELTVMQQLFGNIGRFTNEGTKPQQ